MGQPGPGLSAQRRRGHPGHCHRQWSGQPARPRIRAPARGCHLADPVPATQHASPARLRHALAATRNPELPRFSGPGISRGERDPDRHHQHGGVVHLLADKRHRRQSKHERPGTEQQQRESDHQARFTAAVPGKTQVFASVSGVTSQPLVFETCLVKSVNLQVGNDISNTTFAVTSNASGGITITPTVTDRLGFTLDNPIPVLTFVSTSPANATAGAAPSSGVNAGISTVSTHAPGGASFSAVCAPPGCNVGTEPPQVVYSTTTPSGTPLGTPITGLITGNPQTSGTVYVTSTQCVDSTGTPIPGCQPLIFPVSVKDNSVGASTTLPSAPNSAAFPAGQTA